MTREALPKLDWTLWYRLGVLALTSLNLWFAVHYVSREEFKEITSTVQLHSEKLVAIAATNENMKDVNIRQDAAISDLDKRVRTIETRRP